ncbi:MAG TPA: LUD domain-containing protein [Tepidisphaeraceae bacterium]|nr:LUD domain-containing protein [Tepidisphaeraceae bacterium]
MSERPTVIEKVRRALGRTQPLPTPPVPPAIDESITRLARPDIDLAQLFMQRAGDLKMLVERVSADDVVGRITTFLRETDCRKVALPVSKLFEELDLIEALRIAGIEATRWDRMTLDQLYDGYDCGITDVTYAVAETGSLVIKTSAGHGRGLSLVPMFHVAVIEPNQIVPDLVDLFKRLAREGAGNHVMLISGPSKTADIEMNVVTGVHGPNVVKAFVLAPSPYPPPSPDEREAREQDLSYFDAAFPEPPGADAV